MLNFMAMIFYIKVDEATIVISVVTITLSCINPLKFYVLSVVKEKWVSLPHLHFFHPKVSERCHRERFKAKGKTDHIQRT